LIQFFYSLHSPPQPAGLRTFFGAPLSEAEGLLLLKNVLRIFQIPPSANRTK
jgi:hypothetical protein